MSFGNSRFEIHGAQKIAAALLLAFLLQALWLLAHLPLDLAETRSALAGQALWSTRETLEARSPLIPGDSILAIRLSGALPALAGALGSNGYEFSIYAAPNRWLVRLPFVAFGLWLGGALWWVARRIFGDEGGYVALGLYCFSPPLLLTASTVDSGILSAWGLFGFVYTAIGVAHTLYASPRKWRPRIGLLGVAIGLTAAANLAAAIAGLVIAVAFMLYLAPGRRVAAMIVLAISSGIGTLVFLGCYGFQFADIHASLVVPNVEYLRLTAHHMAMFLILPGGLLETAALLSALVVFAVWRRTRYFGNWSPLLLAVSLPWWPGQFVSGASTMWALHFALTLIGGIFADLLEPTFFRGRFRTQVVIAAFVLVGASVALSLIVVTGA